MAWLFAAFAVIWIVFFLYAMSLDQKMKAIAKDIDALKARVPPTSR
jgi:CcmD family protein